VTIIAVGAERAVICTFKLLKSFVTVSTIDTKSWFG